MVADLLPLKKKKKNPKKERANVNEKRWYDMLYILREREKQSCVKLKVMLCSIYYHPCPELSVCPPPPSVYINKKKQIPLFPTSSSSSSWVSNNESGGTASTSKNSSSSSSRREIEVTTGSSARGRRLLKIREEKRKRQLDNLHNYPAWAKVLEDACKHDHELRAILADSIGNPDLMRKRVQISLSLSLSLSPIPSSVCV